MYLIVDWLALFLRYERASLGKQFVDLVVLEGDVLRRRGLAIEVLSQRRVGVNATGAETVDAEVEIALRVAFNDRWPVEQFAVRS